MPVRQRDVDPDTWARLLAAAAAPSGPTGPPARHPSGVPGGMSEAEFTRAVIAAAQARGWLAYHPLPLRTGTGWATGTQGDAGFPDLVLARAGVVRLAELKVGKNDLTELQRRWVREAGAAVWRPETWELILATLEG